MQGLFSGAVDQLPIREQEVLALYDFDELTMKEVATAMGIGESRVSQIHSSAMIHLRERLFERLRRSSPAMEVSIMSCRAWRQKIAPNLFCDAAKTPLLRFKN